MPSRGMHAGVVTAATPSTAAKYHTLVNQPHAKLHNGHSIPLVGLGTW